MNNDFYKPKKSDCPVCGQKEGAVMGNSEWKHMVSCCSDMCGRSMQKRLRELREDEEMTKLQDQLVAIKDKIINKLDAVTGGDQYEHKRWV